LKKKIERDGELVAWPSFHTFRHTCASFLFEYERNVKQVADWLGHSDPGFTLRTYVHLLDAGVGGAGFFDQVLAPETWSPHR
jgi:integrase